VRLVPVTSFLRETVHESLRPEAPAKMRGLKSALVQREYGLKDGMKLQTFEIPSPDFFFGIFDMVMLAAFIAGWTYTFFQNPHVLEDNPILRAFEANNICVGVDKNGARVAANIAWGVMLLPLACYLMASYLQMQLWDKKENLKMDVALMTIAYLMLMTFGLCFGIEPEFDNDVYDGISDPVLKEGYLTKSAWTIKVHTWGFCIALIGYALTRIVEIRTFLGGHDNKGRLWKDLTAPQRNYVRGMWVHFIWCAVGCLPLLKTLIFESLDPYVKKHPADDWKEIWLTPMSVVMWVWSLGILALPLVLMCLSSAAQEEEEFPMQAFNSAQIQM